MDIDIITLEAEALALVRWLEGEINDLCGDYQYEPHLMPRKSYDRLNRLHSAAVERWERRSGEGYYGMMAEAERSA